jgi:Protein of unknown function with PCYCGC motif
MNRSGLPWIIAGAAAVAIAAILIAVGSGGGRSHPAPRPGVTGSRVLPAATFAGYDRVVRSYEAARQYPQVLDGLYCYCDCRHHFGHRSLLTCFESEHGASCDICLDEAWMAAELYRQGKSLEEIRRAVDARFAG